MDYGLQYKTKYSEINGEKVRSALQFISTHGKFQNMNTREDSRPKNGQVEFHEDKTFLHTEKKFKKWRRNLETQRIPEVELLPKLFKQFEIMKDQENKTNKQKNLIRNELCN